MEKIQNALLQGIVVFFLISGLSYLVEGEVSWTVAIGTAIGYSIVVFILKRR